MTEILLGIYLEDYETCMTSAEQPRWNPTSACPRLGNAEQISSSENQPAGSARKAASDTDTLRLARHTSQLRRFCQYFIYLEREENKVSVTASLLSF